MEKIENAVITQVSLRLERGLLTSGLELNFGGALYQGFGGYALYLPENYSHHRLKSVAGHWIYRVMEIAGVEDWNDLRGQNIRVKRENGVIVSIGHIVQDKWFTPSEEFKED